MKIGLIPFWGGFYEGVLKSNSSSLLFETNPCVCVNSPALTQDFSPSFVKFRSSATRGLWITAVKMSQCEEIMSMLNKQRALAEGLTEMNVPPFDIQRRIKVIYGDHCW
jgi:hypothetical protein